MKSNDFYASTNCLPKNYTQIGNKFYWRLILSPESMKSIFGILKGVKDLVVLKKFKAPLHLTIIKKRIFL